MSKLIPNIWRSKPTRNREAHDESTVLGLLDLPFEIVSQICQVFCPHCTDDTSGLEENTSITRLVGPDDHWAVEREQQSTLRALCLTCKQLRTVAQPVLHHDFKTRRPEDLFLFLRTLLQRRDLCTHVRRLTVSTGGHGWLYAERDVASFHHHAQELGLTLSPRTLSSLDSAWKWTRGGALPPWLAGPEGALPNVVVWRDLVSLLLPLVPPVNEAHILLPPLPQGASENDIPGQRPILVTNDETSDRHVFHLPGLTRLSFGTLAPSTPGYHSRPDVMPTIICPKLRSLHLRYCTDPVDFGHGTSAPQSQPNQALPRPLPLEHLTHLRITSCRVSPTFLDTLLSQVGPHLATFSLALGYPYFVSDGHYLPDVTPAQVISALQPWWSTLRTLRIDLSKAAPRGSKLHKEDLIPSLSHLTHLETLELDLGSIYLTDLDGLLTFGVDTAQAEWDLLVNLLPESIREFFLDGPTHRVYDALEELSDRAASGRFPDLSEVRCDDGPVAHLEHLKDRFGMAGVGFSLRVPKFRQGRSGLY